MTVNVSFDAALQVVRISIGADNFDIPPGAAKVLAASILQAAFSCESQRLKVVQANGPLIRPDASN